MNRLNLISVLKNVLWSLLYGTLFFYTLTFSTPVSWMVFYFFTVVLLGAFLSTFIFWIKSQYQVSLNQNHELNSSLNVKIKSFLPILIPYLTIVINVNETTVTTVLPSLFRLRLTPSFSTAYLPRGKHKKISLHTYGKDLLGFFTHHAKKQVPVDLEIYPHVLSSTLLSGVVRKLETEIALKPFSPQDAMTFRQLREHQQQDALKDIDWKTSFKKQTLMVKDYDKEINGSLNLVFFGYLSPQFEELLSLTYSLYLELSHYQSVQLFIVGEFDEQLLLQQNAESFLTVQPTTQSESLLSVWNDHMPKKGKKIIIAPNEMASSIKEIHEKTSFFLSETTAMNLSEGGD